MIRAHSRINVDATTTQGTKPMASIKHEPLKHRLTAKDGRIFDYVEEYNRILKTGKQKTGTLKQRIAADHERRKRLNFLLSEIRKETASVLVICDDKICAGPLVKA